MPRLCSCGRPAVVGLSENGPFVCMPCWNDYQRNLQQSLALNFAFLNYLEDEMAWIAGFPSAGQPKIRVPQPTYVNAPVSMNTTNNIRVEAGSQVGQINAGAINFLNRAVTEINSAGADKLASALKEFAQAVVDTNELSAEKQKELLDSLEFLVKQVCTKPENRNSSVFKVVFQNVGNIVTAATALSEHWDKLKQMLDGLFL